MHPNLETDFIETAVWDQGIRRTAEVITGPCGSSVYGIYIKGFGEVYKHVMVPFLKVRWPEAIDSLPRRRRL